MSDNQTTEQKHCREEWLAGPTLRETVAELRAVTHRHGVRQYCAPGRAWSSRGFPICSRNPRISRAA